MKLFSLVLTSAIFGTALVASAAMPGGTVVLAPGDMHWTAAPPPVRGQMLTTLSGNPTGTGEAAIRVRMTDGFVNLPHYHSHPEYITVLSGSLLFGFGDTIVKSKATRLPAGSFIMVPTGVHHWSIAQGVTVEQINGLAPFNNIPVKKAM